MKIINSDKVPEALGPYSHATVINGFVFTSGQIPLTMEQLLAMMFKNKLSKF